MIAVLLATATGLNAYGPFDEDDHDTAQRLAAFLECESRDHEDTAEVVSFERVPVDATWKSATVALLDAYEDIREVTLT